MLLTTSLGPSYARAQALVDKVISCKLFKDPKGFACLQFARQPNVLCIQDSCSEVIMCWLPVKGISKCNSYMLSPDIYKTCLFPSRLIHSAPGYALKCHPTYNSQSQDIKLPCPCLEQFNTSCLKVGLLIKMERQ